jgi:acetyltransferase-like isoleucine patch superfamily enzyme
MRPFDIYDRARESRGFLTIAELERLALSATIFDPFSTLISSRASIGPGATFYPGVVVDCDETSTLSIGADAAFHPGTSVTAAGGVTLRVGARVRLMRGATIEGSSTLGDGSQVLGPIHARDVTLDAGGDHTHPDPDGRGGVLKGFGSARGLIVGRGEVVNGAGEFRDAAVERQLAYHPRAE